jgi:hypothetical protein
VLYQTVAEHWPAFRERAEEAGGLPRFIVEEFDAYLQCGRVDAGCVHLVCRRCGHSMLVALSCKRRGFCPLCFVVAEPVEFMGKTPTDVVGRVFARDSMALARVLTGAARGGRNITRVAGAEQSAAEREHAHRGDQDAEC